MKKLKLYLETSVWNFYFADDAPDKKEITLKFFECLNDYEIFISIIVLREFDRAKELKRQTLLELIEKYKPIVLPNNDDAAILAQSYIKAAALSPGSFEDALHAAFCTVAEMDILLSWNMNDLANLNRKQKINAVNMQNDYLKPLEIVTPEGLRSYED